MSKQKGAAEAAAAALTGREAAMRTLAQYKRSFFDIVVAEKDQGVGRRFKRKRDMHEDTFFEAVEVKTHFTVSSKRVFLCFVCLLTFLASCRSLERRAALPTGTTRFAG